MEPLNLHTFESCIELPSTVSKWIRGIFYQEIVIGKELFLFFVQYYFLFLLLLHILKVRSLYSSDKTEINFKVQSYAGHWKQSNLVIMRVRNSVTKSQYSIDIFLFIDVSSLFAKFLNHLNFQNINDFFEFV